MEKNQFMVNNNRTTESVANGFLPDHGRPAGGPRIGQIGAFIHAVAVGAEELGPIARGTCGGNQQAEVHAK